MNTYEKLAETSGESILGWKECPISGERFAVFSGDKALLEKVQVAVGEHVFALPYPDYAPDVRKRLKLMWRNEHHLYHAICGLSGKKTVSRIIPELGVSVYTNEARASDGWECTDHGLDRDGPGTVLEKLQKLAWSVPYQDMIGSLTNTTTNALYTNYTADITDSYMVFDAHTINNCYYLTKARRCDDCVDGHGLTDCRRCYQCIDSQGLMSCGRAQQCSHCHDCWWMLDCDNCQSCIGCVGLEHKQYCVFNEQLTKEEFEAVREEMVAGGWKVGEREERRALLKQRPINTSTVTNSKNIFMSSDIEGSEDLRRCSEMSEAQDCFDVCSYGHKSFLMANSAQVGRFSHHIWMSSTVGKSEHLLYCIDTKKCKHCFGCVNMKLKEYCIFNKQYTKEDYERIVPQLIEQMQQDGSRGDRLPTAHCLFPYNDSKANEIYPVEKVVDKKGTVIESNPLGNGTVTVDNTDSFVSKATLDLGGQETISILRRTKPSEVNLPEGAQTIAARDLPNQCSDEQIPLLAKTIITCVQTGRPYRFTKEELKLYQALCVPLPKKHREERIKERVRKRAR